MAHSKEGSSWSVTGVWKCICTQCGGHYILCGVYNDTGEFSAARKCHAIVFEEKPSEAPERGPFTSIISKSRLLTKGPSEKSRALVFALTILIVTITCLVFLLGVRVIRGENHITQDEDIERILEQILGPNFGHLNISDSDVQNFTFTHGHI